MEHKVLLAVRAMLPKKRKRLGHYLFLGLIAPILFSVISCQKEYSYETSDPTILSFTPSSGSADSTVLISGLNFSTTAANDTVKFNRVSAIVSAATTNQLTVTVPDSATTGYITVTIGSYTATSSTIFTVTTDTIPHITSFAPATGAVGTTVTITGTNFSTTVANNTVMFNGVVATVTAATSTQLTVTVPTGASTGTITVTVGSSTATSTSTFTVS